MNDNRDALLAQSLDSIIEDRRDVLAMAGHPRGSPRNHVAQVCAVQWDQPLHGRTLPVSR